MASALRDLLRRLSGAVRPETPAPRAAHVYRTAAPRDEDDAPAPVDDAEYTALLRALHGPALSARGGPTFERIDPAGLLARWCITGVRQWFWQYQCCTAILFERAGERHIYMPAQRLGPALRLSRLPGHRLVSARPAPEDVDFAPILHSDLHRAADAARWDLIGDGLGLLHLLATFTGRASADLKRPRVIVGVEAREILAQRLGAGAHMEVRAALAKGAFEAQPERGLRRFTALVERTVETDGTSGGYEADLSLVTLAISEELWSYAWEVLWAESEEGIPLS
jgi:hypothetical protein